MTLPSSQMCDKCAFGFNKYGALNELVPLCNKSGTGSLDAMFRVGK